MKTVAILLLFLWMSLSAHAAIVIGNPKGTIVLTEIYNYQCQHCRKMVNVMDTLIENHATLKVRLLPVAFNRQSLVQAAYATERALYHDDFLLIHHVFMLGDFRSMDVLDGYMESTSNASLHAMHQKTINAAVYEGTRQMNALNVHEVPVFIIQTRDSKPIVLTGEHSYEELNSILLTLQGKEAPHAKAR